MENKIKILIVEAELISRKGIVSILNGVPEFEVVGEVANASDALEFIRTNSVDVVITELWIRDEKKSVVATIGREFPGKVKIVVLTASQEAKHLFDAMRLGAQGYLLKSLDPKVWIEVIKSVADENVALASNVACDILRQFAEQLSNENNDSVNALTDREKEILHLVAIGLTNQEIGEKLTISANTVKNHLKRIGDKVGTKNKAQLVAFAVRHGFTVNRKNS